VPRKPAHVSVRQQDAADVVLALESPDFALEAGASAAEL
jgi:hypothetical protein